MRELGNLDRRERLEVGSGPAVNKCPLWGFGIWPPNGGNVVVTRMAAFCNGPEKAD
jgi:hypothetical protein